MRGGTVGCLVIILTSAMASIIPGVSSQGPTQVHVVAEEDPIDLHALCESLARRCVDLDLAAYGMTPLATAVPPPPEGTLVAVDHGESVNVHATLLGQRLKVHGVVSVNQSITWSGSESDARQPNVPCSDERGCPDLIVDPLDLTISIARSEETFPADDCAVRENSTEPGDRVLVRFTFTSPNRGPGSLIVGDPDDHPEWFEWGECHGHWHFREYADYRFWDPAGYAVWKTIRTAYPQAAPEDLLDTFPELRDHFRAGHKQGFCIWDSLPYPGIGGLADPRTFRDCAENQGISVGWADQYPAGLDGQWVDVTGLEPGPYVLEAEVNPERFYAEESYSNNDVAFLTVLP